jgi:hypothetical protein
VMLVVRVLAAHRIGFGDSEALYASYALHPQPAYLDHPGLVGVFAGAIGGGTAPTPAVAHTVTAVMATLVPWLLLAAARGAGASLRSATIAALAVAVVPEIAIGLFAMTPDLLLAVTWIGALGLASAALRVSATSTRAHLMFVGAGLLAGIAITAKVSGVTLFAALVVAYASRHARAHAKTIWPWAGILAGLVAVVPIVLYEARTGEPMLRHRLVDTQGAAGISFRNAGAVLLGQLAYLSPLVVIVAVIVVRDLFRARKDDAVSALLFTAFLLPMAVLLPLSLWSRVAEPHWIAPALLALPIHFARRGLPLGVGLARSTIATALAVTALAHAWVLVPALTRILPSSVDLRRDITSELSGWPEAVRLVRRVAFESAIPGQERGDLVVVGPHWVVCAQLHAALRADLPVGCATPIEDDFDRWYPRSTWRRAETLVLVTDDRFETTPATSFPEHVVTREVKLDVFRGGRVARTFRIFVLERRAAG